VIADFSAVCLTETAHDVVKVEGGRGRARPATLKVSLGYRDGFIGEGQISYAGLGAVERGRLALAIVEERIRLTGLAAAELRGDLIGIDALHGPAISNGSAPPYEVRVRVAGRTATLADAQRIGSEVEALYTNGPAGGGGATAAAREVLNMASTLIPRDLVTCHVAIETA
jgi:acyclic terpene utilization AtuA family protein